jgi:hypothetical protein
MARFSKAFLVAALNLTAVGASHAAVVYSNLSPLGDHHTGGGVFAPQQRTIINSAGATGWRYNNAASGGSVGIDTTFARSGDGSVRLQGTQNASRADILYVAGSTAGPNSNLGLTSNYSAHLGALSGLDAFSFDWFREVGTGARNNLAPAFRVLLDRDGKLNTLFDRGELIFELVYQPGAAFVAPRNQWITSTASGSAYLHNTGLGLGRAYNINRTGYAYDGTLDQWQGSRQLNSAVILGFGVSMGSGWGGAYKGAVDNISWTINGQTTKTNFEVVPHAEVPEPGSLALVALALAGLGVVTRRNRKTR